MIDKCRNRGLLLGSLAMGCPTLPYELTPPATAAPVRHDKPSTSQEAIVRPIKTASGRREIRNGDDPQPVNSSIASQAENCKQTPAIVTKCELAGFVDT